MSYCQRESHNAGQADSPEKTIVAKTLTGACHTLQVHGTDSIGSLKNQLKSKDSTLKQHLLGLVYAGKLLDNKQTVESCGIRNGETVLIILD